MILVSSESSTISFHRSSNMKIWKIHDNEFDDFPIPNANHGAGICTPTFTRTKSPSYVGVHIPAPWHHGSHTGMIIHHYPYYRGSFLLNVLKVPRDGNPSMRLIRATNRYHVPSYETWFYHIHQRYGLKYSPWLPYAKHIYIYILYIYITIYIYRCKIM